MIVVLVILAILAAIMVPQLVGYIDRAKDKQYEIRGRNILIAAQTLVDEEYALASIGADGTEAIDTEHIILAKGPENGLQLDAAILQLAEEKDVTISTIEVGAKYKIKKLELDFTNPTKYGQYLNTTGWTFQDKAF